MKHLKKFENNNTAKNFKPGDMVKITPKDNYLIEIKDFLNNNIGEIYNIEHNKYGEDYYFYNIKYYNVPKTLYYYTRYMGTFPDDGLKTQGEIFTAVDYQIRLATPEEIMDFKIKLFENIEPERKVEYYDNGNIKSLIYSKNGYYHREDGPAYQIWNEDGILIKMIYYFNGNKHREDGPAYQTWYNDGNKKTIVYYLNDTRHNINSPAHIQWFENGNKFIEEYYINGVLDRNDGPARRTWHINGNIKTEIYYKNGKYHREDGVAYISWLVRGKIEEEDYYLNSRYYTYENWLSELKRINSPHYKEQQDIYNMKQNIKVYNI